MTNITKFPNKMGMDDEFSNVPKEEMATMRRMHRACEELQAVDGAEYSVIRIQIIEEKQIVCGVQTNNFDELIGGTSPNKRGVPVQRKGDEFSIDDKKTKAEVDKLIDAAIWNKDNDSPP